MKICVVGGGSIGVLTSALLSKNSENKVYLLVSNSEGWTNKIHADAEYNENIFDSTIYKITDDAEEAIKGAAFVLIAVPSYGVENKINLIHPFLDKETFVGVIPGSGGSEFYLKKLLSEGFTVFGTQRVVIGGRASEKGKSVYVFWLKDNMQVAVLPKSKTEDVCKVLDKAFGFECERLQSFLSVSLAPSNPILHTSRIYSFFKDYSDGVLYHSIKKFYSDWNDDSSEACINCDIELVKLMDFLKNKGCDLSGLKNIRQHYEVNTVEEFTNKIRSIKSWQRAIVPLKKVEGGYIPDLEERYFLEDFEYGLFVIKSFCSICEIQTPQIDKIIKWLEKIFKKEYFKGNTFNGKDLINLPLPQNYGILNINDILNFYNK